MTFRTSS
ncbi:hypothetical protein D038_0615A, partial [Vibrio parahaemolyticus IDH02189]